MAELRAIDADPPGAGVIEVLKKMLESAKEGQLSSVAIAVVQRDGSPNWDWSDAPNNSTLIGAIERMKAAIIRDADEG